MVDPKLVALSSPDLQAPALPLDPTNCCVHLEALIGPSPDSCEVFYFTAVTPSWLAASPTSWGHGLLIVQSFSWGTVQMAVELQLRHASRSSWELVAAELGRFMRWEFDGCNR